MREGDDEHDGNVPEPQGRFAGAGFVRARRRFG